MITPQQDLFECGSASMKYVQPNCSCVISVLKQREPAHFIITAAKFASLSVPFVTTSMYIYYMYEYVIHDRCLFLTVVQCINEILLLPTKHFWSCLT